MKMFVRKESKYPRTQRGTAALAVLSLLPPALAWLYPVCWWFLMYKADSDFVAGLSFTLPLMLFASVPTLLLCGLILAFGNMKNYRMGAWFCAASVLTWFSTAGALDKAREVRFDRFLQVPGTAQPIIAAIKQYQVDNGEPPRRVEHLVPDYLPVVPGTGIPVYPEFRYSDKSDTPPNEWELSVPALTGGNFDSFLYLPHQNYPARGYGGWLEPLAGWAYVHE